MIDGTNGDCWATLERVVALAVDLARESEALDRLGHRATAGEIRAAATLAAVAVRRLLASVEAAQGGETPGPTSTIEQIGERLRRAALDGENGEPGGGR